MIDKELSTSLKKGVAEVGLSTSAALIGTAVGGVPGLLIGAGAAPLVKLAHTIGLGIFERRKARAESILDISMINHEEQFLETISNDCCKADQVYAMLEDALKSDPIFDGVFGKLIGMYVSADCTEQKERILILEDIIKSIRSIHLKIIMTIYNNGGEMAASEIADAVDIPEIELRSVVRNLELQGILLDMEKKPVIWKLREHGRAIAKLVEKGEE